MKQLITQSAIRVIVTIVVATCIAMKFPEGTIIACAVGESLGIIIEQCS